MDRKHFRFTGLLVLASSFLIVSCAHGGSSSSSETAKSSSANSSTPTTSQSSTTSSTPASSSTEEKITFTLNSPEDGGTLQTVDDEVESYLKASFSVDATKDAKDASYKIIAQDDARGFDAQESSIEFEVSKKGTYFVRFSTASDLATYQVRPTSLVATNTYAASMLTLYPATHYYAQVVDEAGKAISDIFNFTTEAAPRFISADSDTASNIRDIGGWAAGEGKRIRYGMIYRGSSIDDLDAAGRKVLGDYLGINSEIDLRVPGGDTTYQSVNMIDMTHPYYVCNMGNYQSAQAAVAGDITNAIYKDAVKTLFTALGTASNYPVYMHDINGAVRVGDASLLIEGLCGASWSDISKDYELSSFAKALYARDDATWTAKHSAITALGTATNTLQECVNTYLLSTGLTQENIDAVKAILVENSTEPIENSDTYVKASLKAPVHTTVYGGTVDKEWAVEGESVKATANAPLSGSTFAGWSDGGTTAEYTFTAAKSQVLRAAYTDSDEVTSAEAKDLISHSKIDHYSMPGTTYEMVDTPTASSASKRAARLHGTAASDDWAQAFVKLDDMVTVKSSTITFDIKHTKGASGWISFTCFDASMKQVGAETALSDIKAVSDDAWQSITLSGPSDSTIAYVRFCAQTYTNGGGEESEFYLDNLAITSFESEKYVETGTPGTSGYSLKNMENMEQDTGWETSTTAFDFQEKYGSDSLSSLKVSFAGKTADSWNGFFVALDPEWSLADKKINALPDMTKGIFSGDVKFDNCTAGLETKIVGLSTWADTGMVDLTLTAEENGWYHFNYDLTTLPKIPTEIKSTIRIVMRATNATADSVMYLDNIQQVIA
jgi:protein-tyrosine phosphatase